MIMSAKLKLSEVAFGLVVATVASGAWTASPGWSTGSYDDRLQAIRRSAPANAVALEEFLSVPPASAGVSSGELNALKNEAGMTLLALPQLPEALAGRFLALAGNADTDPVWRDYCVQFLGMGFPRWSAADKKAVAAFLVDVARKGRGATGGTALIALCNNVNAPEIDQERVQQLALTAVKDASYGDAGRISALQVCARLNVKAALPEARSLAFSSATLRSSAIATIGALGDLSDEAALRVWAKSTDPSIRVPAVAALKRIEDRFSGSGIGVRL